MRFLLGDETAISRYFSRSRERRGFDALSDGMVARRRRATPQAAMKKAQTRRDAAATARTSPGSSTAQAAELSGDRAKTYEAYKAMLPDDRTRPRGAAGADAAEDRGGRHRHRDGAGQEGASRSGPTTSACSGRSSTCSRSRRTGPGARETLTASIHARLLPRDVGTRRDAVLSLADARAALAAGNTAPRQRGGAAGQPPGADADPGGGAGGAGACRATAPSARR